VRTIHRIVVSALVFSKNDKLLMCKKPATSKGVYVDCWQIPGGGVDEGENKLQALIREMKEEIGINISETKIIPVDYKYNGESKKTLKETGERVFVKMDFNAYKVFILDMNSNEINIKLNDEFSEYKWFDTAALKNIKLAPPSILLFKKLGYL
jgi:8-oxo-dGTP pyrophosphatase MutT (NUDIX family)